MWPKKKKEEEVEESWPLGYTAGGPMTVFTKCKCLSHKPTLAELYTFSYILHPFFTSSPDPGHLQSRLPVITYKLNQTEMWPESRFCSVLNKQSREPDRNVIKLKVTFLFQKKIFKTNPFPLWNKFLKLKQYGSKANTLPNTSQFEWRFLLETRSKKSPSHEKKMISFGGS